VLPVRSPVVFDSLGAPRHARVGESARVLIRPLRSPNPKPLLEGECDWPAGSS
jgi:hypothetical protein